MKMPTSPVGSRTITRPARWTEGFTLVEVVVVLVVMVISVAVVAPALIPRPPTTEDGIAEPLRTARRLALSRGETMYLDLTATGDWTIQGASSASEGTLAPFADCLVVVLIPLVDHEIPVAHHHHPVDVAVGPFADFAIQRNKGRSI